MINTAKPEDSLFGHDMRILDVDCICMESDSAGKAKSKRIRRDRSVELELLHNAESSEQTD